MTDKGSLSLKTEQKARSKKHAGWDSLAGSITMPLLWQPNANMYPPLSSEALSLKFVTGLADS